jgi:glycosyltransferase involved in cell wall biosynthesis
MQNPLVSILIAQYNNGHFFKDCYQSILNQTYQNWEVIIVDDGSTDDSLTVIKQIIGNDSRFNLFLNDENKGCGYAKNRCASLANGEILGFLDPDDALKNDAIQKMVLEHSKSDEIAIITSKFELVDLDMKFIATGTQGAVITAGKSYLTDTQGKLTAFATFKKAKYDSSVGIDSMMKRAVDQDLYYKLEEQGSHVFINEALYLYRIHKKSISANNNVYKARYWHFYAMIAAYERRRKFNSKTVNFTKLQLQKMKSNYYMTRFERAKEGKKQCVKYYFLFKAIIVFPNHNIKYKLKSLLQI